MKGTGSLLRLSWLSHVPTAAMGQSRMSVGTQKQPAMSRLLMADS